MQAIRGLALLLVLPLVATEASTPSANGWTPTLERISTGVVSIQIDAARAFDTDWNTSSQATGFVVDAKRGLILTNRHVVTPGPVTAQATFLNREEVELVPVYRDPVHDFGFYRYDPSKLRFIQPAELPLYPEGAQVGVEIRVVGNDAGEQLSILAGTLARLDREAPDYGAGKYNDFNTFYYQAASGTSGGSSGSPVIDIAGRVVALNAGGSSGAASSFYLPLPAVVRALKRIQDAVDVPRGTLQTVFRYTPYDELRRLGLPPDLEAAARTFAPARTGMLVVGEVQRGSAAYGKLAVGDILVALAGRPIADFDQLGQQLDAAVGGTLALELRRGGVAVALELPVEDLHAITPDAYVEVGDGVLNTLSWQMARHMNVAVRGVYVANPGYVFGSAGIPRAAVITELNGVAVDSVEAARDILASLAHGQRVPLRYFTMDETKVARLETVRMDRAWYPARYCRRDDRLGKWSCEDLKDTGRRAPSVAAEASYPKTGDRAVDALAPSLVLVHFSMPYPVSGVTERNYYGTGVIVDAARGLVAVDRNTVPVAIGDVRLTFAGSVEVDGEVAFVHPLHNLALVRYDPALIGATPVRSAGFSQRLSRAGEEVHIVGLRENHQLAVQRARVATLAPVSFPLSRTLQFRDANLETLRLVNGPSDFDGVVADAQGRVLALWSSFAFESGRQVEQINMGIPAALVTGMLEHARDGKPLYSIEAEFEPLTLAQARRLGLGEDWIARLAAHGPERRQVLSVVRTVAGSPAALQLMPGDLLLAIDGQLVATSGELRAAVNADQLDLTLWRNGQEQPLPLKTVLLTGRDVDRLLIWAGGILQEPHRAMSAQRGIAPEGVFVAFFMYGSPAARYKLWAGRRITEVDGVAVADLDAFMAAVAGRADRSSIRLKTVNWNDAVDVITLRLDQHYWPAYELRREGGQWQRTELE